ncbi:MAG: DUF5320 domain-containing protein [Desulfonatronovibrio sp.]
MPGGDRTGPLGQGPRTGRAQGFCSGGNAPGFNSFRGQDRFTGRGRRNSPGARGRGRGFWCRGNWSQSRNWE